MNELDAMFEKIEQLEGDPPEITQAIRRIIEIDYPKELRMDLYGPFLPEEYQI